MVGKRHH